MYNEQLESLIDAALADGVLTEKEKQVILKKAQSLGVDPDETLIIIEARIHELQRKGNADLDLSDTNIARMIKQYRKDFDGINKTHAVRQFVPFTKTGKRGKYEESIMHDYEGTDRAKKAYLKDLNPDGKVETIAALRFFLSFLPSCDEVAKGVSAIAEIANKRFRSVYNEAKTKYNSDSFFTQKLEDIRNDYNMIYDRIMQQIDNADSEIDKIDNTFKKRKKINIVISYILLFEWLFFSVWLIVIEEWDWWWGFALCFVLNIITLLIYWRVVYDGVSDFFDYITCRFIKNSRQGLMDSKRELKDWQNEFRAISEMFQKI